MKFVYGLLLFVLVSCAHNSTQKQNPSAKKRSGQKTAIKSVKKAKTNYRSTAAKVSCTLKNDTRVLTHSLLTKGGCAVDYEKFGDTAQVANAKYNLAHCESVLERIKNRLKDAGFSCD